MFVLGLTGGIGSGKSTAADQFAERGIDVIDADVVAREVVEPPSVALDAIASRFGADILTEDGSLNRSLLRKIVFDDPAQRRWLEELTHPMIAARIESLIEQAKPPFCVLVSPLLLETEQVKFVDRVAVVDVTEAQQLQRTLARDDSSESTIRAIMAAQCGRQERLDRADYVLDNSKDPQHLLQQVNALYQSLSSELQV